MIQSNPSRAVRDPARVAAVRATGLVISADATPRQTARLLAAGARDHLTKPLDVDQFLASVDGLLLQAIPALGDVASAL